MTVCPLCNRLLLMSKETPPHAMNAAIEPRTFLGMQASDWRTVTIGWSISAVVAVGGSMLARWIW